ncbi:MAG: ROS/MUCR transcriptional regulator protein [Caudoviricetes sp.]|nr:MAG: ROS/MUCR transcriptional regulator protein [Caudoviricetes sp.]
MPHKDRKKKLAYLASYRAKNRPSPEIQERNDLPPIGGIEFSVDGEKVRCHACGKWYRSLNTHLKTHGYTQETYKEAYALKRTASLLPPATAEKYREQALARGQGANWANALPPPSGRPTGQEARLQARVEASEARKGKNMRAGEKSGG